MFTSKKIILATTSPHRIQSFAALGIEFTSEASNVDEYHENRPKDAKELVQYLAALKGEAVAENHAAGIIIGFDSVGCLGSEILEKPLSREEAFDRLQRLSGKTFYFYTGIWMKNTASGLIQQKLAETKIVMRAINDQEIRKYLHQDSKYNTYAVGFDPISHYSSTFVESIQGSYNNFLRGIPLEVIVEMLQKI